MKSNLALSTEQALEILDENELIHGMADNAALVASEDGNFIKIIFCHLKNYGRVPLKGIHTRPKCSSDVIGAVIDAERNNLKFVYLYTDSKPAMYALGGRGFGWADRAMWRIGKRLASKGSGKLRLVK